MPMQQPMTKNYCKERGLFKASPKECLNYTSTSKCFQGNGKCDAKELLLVEREISPELLGRVEAALEAYDNADPPMNRKAFAEYIIKVSREIADD